ncbi:PHD finger protein ING2-like protein [Drosera capensis]
MAIARTGMPVRCPLSFKGCSTRSASSTNDLKTKYCLGMSSHGSRKGNSEDDEDVFEKMRKDIEASQDNALSLCTEKVLLARQAYDLIDSHIKRLDEDLHNFAEDLKQEGKISPDEPAILPPMPIVPKIEKRKIIYGTPQSRRFEYRDRDWDRERDKDSELMPPPGSHKKDDIDQPIDPNEPTYCICHQVSFGDMIACDNENVKIRKNFIKLGFFTNDCTTAVHQPRAKRESRQG